jgi:hypothetical protein
MKSMTFINLNDIMDILLANNDGYRVKGLITIDK